MLDFYVFSFVYSSMMRETLRMILLTFVLFTDGGGSSFLNKDMKKVKKSKKDLTFIVNI
jgi:hypothetical protein